MAKVELSVAFLVAPRELQYLVGKTRYFVSPSGRMPVRLSLAGSRADLARFEVRQPSLLADAV